MDEPKVKKPLILHLFFHENANSFYFITAQVAKMAQTLFTLSHVAYRPTVYKTGARKSRGIVMFWKTATSEDPENSYHF